MAPFFFIRHINTRLESQCGTPAQKPTVKASHGRNPKVPTFKFQIFKDALHSALKRKGAATFLGIRVFTTSISTTTKDLHFKLSINLQSPVFFLFSNNPQNERRKPTRNQTEILQIQRPKPAPQMSERQTQHDQLVEAEVGFSDREELGRREVENQSPVEETAVGFNGYLGYGE